MPLTIPVVLIVIWASDAIGDFIAALAILSQIRRTGWTTISYLGLMMLALGVSAIVDAITLLSVYREIPQNLLLFRDVVRFCRTVATWTFNLHFLGFIGARKELVANGKPTADTNSDGENG